MTIFDIARVCHEANRAYCRTLGDFSHLSWDNAPPFVIASCFNGVKYKLTNPRSTPEDQHNNWMNEKLSNGWKLGPTKDTSKKEHPCLVPYYDLPQEQKNKDYLFQAIVEVFRPEVKQ